MVIDPEIQQLAARLQAKELHAARSGREVMQVLVQVCSNSQAGNPQAFFEEFVAAIQALLAAMPAYAPPLNVMHRLLWRLEKGLAEHASLDEIKTSLANEANSYQAWSENARMLVPRLAAKLIPNGAILFTFTLSETVLNTLRYARARGKTFHVLVTESRPNNDGLATAAHLEKMGFTVDISLDACLSEMLSRADLMMVGAEAIMADGSAVCKVGTYPAALVARAHGVPVYVVVDTMKLNLTSQTGLPLRMDPIPDEMVLEKPHSEQVKVIGHLFDQTPPELLTGIVTEKGLMSPAECVGIMRAMPYSHKLSELLIAWSYRSGSSHA